MVELKGVKTLEIDVNQGFMLDAETQRRELQGVASWDNPHKLSIPLQPPFFQSVEPVFRHPNPGLFQARGDD